MAFLNLASLIPACSSFFLFFLCSSDKVVPPTRQANSVETENRPASDVSGRRCGGCFAVRVFIIEQYDVITYISADLFFWTGFLCSNGFFQLCTVLVGARSPLAV